MNDMTVATVPKSDQINADDLIGRNLTIRVREVCISAGQEQPVSIFFEGSDKPFRPCKSMSRVLVTAWGPDARKYVGRSMTLYRDASVKWGGLEVGGIRISYLSDIKRKLTMSLTATKGKWRTFEVQPLKATGKSQLAAQREENGHSDDPDDAPPVWDEPSDRLRAHLATVEGDEARDAINHAMTQAWWKPMKAANPALAGVLRDMAQARIEGRDIEEAA